MIHFYTHITEVFCYLWFCGNVMLCGNSSLFHENRRQQHKIGSVFLTAQNIMDAEHIRRPLCPWRTEIFQGSKVILWNAVLLEICCMYIHTMGKRKCGSLWILLYSCLLKLRLMLAHTVFHTTLVQDVINRGTMKGWGRQYSQFISELPSQFFVSLILLWIVV
jgi:hypothetical protein